MLPLLLPSCLALFAVAAVAAGNDAKHFEALVGLVLVAACVSAFVIAEVCWIHWKTVQGDESWWVALTWFPTFVQENEGTALIAAIFTGFGSWSAYRSTAVGARE